jgi:amino acid transporter
MKLLGTFSGVFVPAFEAILGAVLFVILPHLVAEQGVIPMLLIVFIANTLTTATTFSISDCTSNLQRVGAGGMYAVSKRSLGMAFGGSIGIQLFIAQAASIGFYAIIFANPVQSLLLNFEPWTGFLASMDLQGNILAQKQLIATGLVILGFLSGIIGADFVSKLQTFIFVILIISVSSVMAGPFLGLTMNGDAVFSPGTFNLFGSGTTYTFLAAFITFFPAVTGIDAGVGMSGNLKDPRKSLAKGTFVAIGITYVIYSVLVLIYGQFKNPSLLNMIGADTIPSTNDVLFAESTFIWTVVLIGILVATTSSALAYFVTAPRTAQALALDELLPRWLGFLKKDFTKSGTEPKYATILTLFIALGVIWAPGGEGFATKIVGIAFLVVYGWINLAAFLERISGNPSFRPSSKNHWAISLFGFLMAMIIIVLDNPLIGLLIIASQLIIFLLLLKYKSGGKIEGVWWGVLFSLVNWAFIRLKGIIQGTKNWRPILGVFVFADKKAESEKVLELGREIGAFKGITVTNILKGSKIENIAFNLTEDTQTINPPGDNFDAAVSSVVQAAVPGGLNINTVFLPLDNRLNLVALTEEFMERGRNVLLYKEGTVPEGASNRIDVWWKGEENGNFMALLSYIMIQSDLEQHRSKRSIRLIRKIDADEDEKIARFEMESLLRGARLVGEILILKADEKNIQDTIRDVSIDAALILIGMPGKKAGGITKMFNLEKFVFSRELDKFDNFPPILFVKAARIMNLLE